MRFRRTRARAAPGVTCVSSGPEVGRRARANGGGCGGDRLVELAGERGEQVSGLRRRYTLRHRAGIDREMRPLVHGPRASIARA